LGKGGKDRVVPFASAFKETLALHHDRLRRRGASYLLESSWKRPHCDRGVRRLLERYARAAGLPQPISGKAKRHPVAWAVIMASPLRVLIAEDQYLMREGTRRLVADVEGVEVVGTASDYESVLREAKRLLPDVVLMDIKMPPTETMEGIQAAHVIKRERPETGILILSQHDDESYVWALLE
jgi:CheY-like chemotaxis protein